MPKGTLVKNKKGFTLIELIVVIVIIGILAAIAVPRFMGAQDRARIGACDSDINIVMKALALYEVERSSYVVAAGMNYAALTPLIVDLNGNAYMRLPAGDNWDVATFSYTGDAIAYTITCNALDNSATLRTGTPGGIQ